MVVFGRALTQLPRINVRTSGVPGGCFAGPYWVANTSAAATTFTVGRVHASVFVDPSATGDNQLHLSFTTDAGIAAAGVDRVDVQLQSPSGTVSGIEMQLLGPGHFAGSFTAASPGRYGVRVSIPSNADSSAGTGTYSFTINAA